MFVVVLFFFKQKTAYEMRISDWSSDVCSSDLAVCVTQSTSPMPDAGPQVSGSQMTPFSQRWSPAGRGVTAENSPNGRAVRAIGSTTVAGAKGMRVVPPGQ